MRRVMLGIAVAVLASGCTGQQKLSEEKVKMTKAEGDVAKQKSDKEVATSSEGCRIEKFTIPSPSMKRDIRLAIVLPPEYDKHPDKQYPILYTLHGASAPYATWSEMSPLRRALGRMPMIVTCFDGDKASMYVDSTTRPESQFTTFFFDEFVPYVDKHYRVDTQKRGVTGFSMGGFGAMHYMLTRPEMFRSVSGLSSAYGGGGNRWLVGLLGPYEDNKEAHEACDIYKRLTDYVAQGRKLPPIYQHCGTEDFLVGNNRKFRDLLVNLNKRIGERLAAKVSDIADQKERRDKLAALMAEQQIDFSYTESPGAHNWQFWRDASQAVVEFHWRSFNKQRRHVATPSARTGTNDRPTGTPPEFW